jgi:hypothetical protein
MALCHFLDKNGSLSGRLRRAPALAESERSAILTTLMKRYPVLATRISQSRDRDGRFDIATPLWGREAEAALTPTWRLIG